MPEGHKTHFVAREHSNRFTGQKVQVTSPQGRFRVDAKKVSGRILDHVEAAGKHLFYHFDGGRIIHVHLGRYGKYRELCNPPSAPVGQVRMRMRGEAFTIDLNGPSTCRVIDQSVRDEVVGKLGPDPLAGGKKSDVWESLCKSNKPIGALLLDQSLIAGVGNIFRAEVLFEVGLHPEVPGSKLTKEQFDAIWKSLVRMMKVGLKHGRIITVTAKEAGVPLAKVENKKRFRVYRCERCPRCNTKIRTIEVASRKIYLCPKCQPS